jgi:AraC-like DNA-binding protein
MNMLQKRIVFLLVIILFSHFSISQTQKELNKMNYDELKTAFFENENNVSKQKLYAKEYLARGKRENYQSKLARGYYYYSLTEKNLNISIKYLDSIIRVYKPNNQDVHFPILAYLQKGILFEKKFNYKEAIKNYLIVERMSLEFQNNEYYFESKYAMGKLKSENLGEVEDGLKLFKECLLFFKDKDIRSNYFSDSYQRTLFALADSYKTLNQLDSASYYNKLGFIESENTKNEKLHYLFILNEGANQTLKKNYEAAIDSVDLALPKLKKMNNIGNNVLASYYYYGKAYQGLKNNKKAIENFQRVDSIYQKSKLITPEFTDGYRFLIDYYKKANDKEKQLYYINTLMSIDSSFQKNYKLITQKIHKEYDIPHLIEEKENIIKTLNNDQKVNYGIIGILGLIVFGSVFFSIHQIKQKKQYQERFNNLVLDTEEIKPIKPIQNTSKNNSTSLEISDEIVSAVLNKLSHFEKEKRFLNPSISINNLAQEFNTNSKYLSIVINQTLDKSFIHYINDLRIDNIVSELKINKNLRKYTISGIAEEAGFNTGESFSKAFFKRTGIKPSYFVKKLNEI